MINKKKASSSSSNEDNHKSCNHKMFLDKKKLLEMQKEIVLLQRENAELNHNFKIKELLVIRENDQLHHQREMERQRIKSAEIRRTQERKMSGGFMQEYGRKSN